MTVSDNEATALNLWDSIARGDASRLREILSPRCVWKMYGRGPLAGAYTGVEAILEFMASIGERAEVLESTLLELFSSPLGAVIRYEIHAERRGRVLDIEHLFLIRIEGGRVVEGVFAPIDQDRYDEFWIDEEPGVVRGSFRSRTRSAARG